MPASPSQLAPAPAAGPRSDENPTLRLEQFLPYRLSVLSQLISASLNDRYFEPSRLTIPQWRVMAALGRFAPLAAAHVAERTVMDKVTVSRAVGRLMAAGLVERATDDQDRRRSALRLSPAGRAMHDRIVPLALEYEQALWAGLTPAERAEFERLVERLQARAETLQAAAKPGPAPRLAGARPPVR